MHGVKAAIASHQQNASSDREESGAPKNNVGLEAIEPCSIACNDQSQTICGSIQQKLLNFIYPVKMGKQPSSDNAITHALTKIDEFTGALLKSPEHLQSIASYQTQTRLSQQKQADEQNGSLELNHQKNKHDTQVRCLSITARDL